MGFLRCDNSPNAAAITRYHADAAEPPRRPRISAPGDARLHIGSSGHCPAVRIIGAQFLPKPNDGQPHPLTQLGSNRRGSNGRPAELQMDVGFFRRVRAATGRDAKRCRDASGRHNSTLAPRGAVQLRGRASACDGRDHLGADEKPSDFTSVLPSGKIISALLFDGYTLALGVFLSFAG